MIQEIFNLFNELTQDTKIKITIFILAISFITLIATIHHNRKDELFQTTFTKPREKFLYLISTSLLKSILAILSSIIFFIYFMETYYSEFDLSEFLSSLKGDFFYFLRFLLIISLFFILFLWIINPIFSCIIYLYRILTKKEKEQYYFLSETCSYTSKIKKETHIYLLEFINKDDILCCYYLDKKKINIIIPYESLIGINIYLDNLTFSEIKRKLNDNFYNFSIIQKVIFISIFYVYGNTIIHFLTLNKTFWNIIITLVLLFLFFPTIKKTSKKVKGKIAKRTFKK